MKKTMSQYFAVLLLLASLSFSAVAKEEAVDCEDAISTLDINHCAYLKLEIAQAELTKYLKTSYEHNAHDPELIEAIKLAQKDWEAYSTSHCDSIYTQWRDGTIRGVMAISCRTRLTKLRTHEVWRSFLTYMDSTSPVLAEPKVP